MPKVIAGRKHSKESVITFHDQECEYSVLGPYSAKYMTRVMRQVSDGYSGVNGMSVLSLVPEEKTKCYQGLPLNKRQSAESVYSSNSRVYLLHKRRGMGSSGMLASNHSLPTRSGEKSITQRVLSAKIHRVKQLQNQLADAHYHLNELSNENRILRAMQKKQEIALQRYEDSNAELPKVLNSHTEEVRALQARCKQLKQQLKQTTEKLKEREMELQQLKDEHKHLLDLSKDRSLPEREKLLAQMTDLSVQVAKQNETISTLQRRLTLEAKNYRHQLQMEIMKHKDTRHDLDLAINNADKLSSIIEMKERLLNNPTAKRVTKQVSNPTISTQRPISRDRSRPTRINNVEALIRDDNNTNSSSSDNDQLSKLCENSRYVSSALSQEENLPSDGEVRSRSALTNHSRAASSKSVTPIHIRKDKSELKKEVTSENNIIELAKSVQDGMADILSFREEIDLDSSRDDIEQKINSLKSDLLNKIKTDDTASRKSSALKSDMEGTEIQRSRTLSRRSSGVSFKGGTPAEELIYTDMKKFQEDNNLGEQWAPPEVSSIERKFKSGKSLDFCKGIMQDIENSSKTIDMHMKEYSSSRFDSEQLEQQLLTLDKMNNLVNHDTLAKLPNDALEELNNNFKALSGISGDSKPVPRKRSIPGTRNAVQRNGNAFGDASMSNQDLLNDLLGKQ